MRLAAKFAAHSQQEILRSLGLRKSPPRLPELATTRGAVRLAVSCQSEWMHHVKMLPSLEMKLVVQQLIESGLILVRKAIGNHQRQRAQHLGKDAMTADRRFLDSGLVLHPVHK